MLNLKFEDKVKVWKDLRSDLETHPKPFQRLLNFVNTLPMSSQKVNPWDPKTQVQPWELIEKGSFTNYEFSLLICYTLQLTDRFSDSQIEIHISKNIKNNEQLYLVYLDNTVVIGYGNNVIRVEELPTYIISERVYCMPKLH